MSNQWLFHVMVWIKPSAPSGISTPIHFLSFFLSLFSDNSWKCRSSNCNYSYSSQFQLVTLFSLSQMVSSNYLQLYHFNFFVHSFIYNSVWKVPTIYCKLYSHILQWSLPESFRIHFHFFYFMYHVLQIWTHRKVSKSYELINYTTFFTQHYACIICTLCYFIVFLAYCKCFSQETLNSFAVLYYFRILI